MTPSFAPAPGPTWSLNGHQKPTKSISETSKNQFPLTRLKLSYLDNDPTPPETLTRSGHPLKPLSRLKASIFELRPGVLHQQQKKKKKKSQARGNVITLHTNTCNMTGNGFPRGSLTVWLSSIPANSCLAISQQMNPLSLHMFSLLSTLIFVCFV